MDLRRAEQDYHLGVGPQAFQIILAGLLDFGQLHSSLYLDLDLIEGPIVSVFQGKIVSLKFSPARVLDL